MPNRVFDVYSQVALVGEQADEEHQLLRVWRICSALPTRCPWTANQTVESVLDYIAEEASEVRAELPVEGASITPPPTKLENELGDLLFDVILAIQVSQQLHDTDCTRILDGIEKKLRRRTSFMFGEKLKAPPPVDEEEAEKLWDIAKENEKIKLRARKLKKKSSVGDLLINWSKKKFSIGDFLLTWSGIVVIFAVFWLIFRENKIVF